MSKSKVEVIVELIVYKQIVYKQRLIKMSKFPESLYNDLDLSVEVKEILNKRWNDYMEKTIKEAIEESKKITIKVKIGTYDKRGKIESE